MLLDYSHGLFVKPLPHNCRVCLLLKIELCHLQRLCVVRHCMEDINLHDLWYTLELLSSRLDHFFDHLNLMLKIELGRHQLL